MLHSFTASVIKGKEISLLVTKDLLNILICAYYSAENWGVERLKISGFSAHLTGSLGRITFLWHFNGIHYKG